jgi:hypothetical protein
MTSTPVSMIPDVATQLIFSGFPSLNVKASGKPAADPSSRLFRAAKFPLDGRNAR